MLVINKVRLAKSFFAAALMSQLTVVIAGELRLASGVPPAHPAHNPLYTEFQEQLPVVSEGRLSASLLGTEIVSLPKMRTGITSKLVDIGLFLPAYFPADLPDINLVGNMAFLSQNPQAMGAALTEYIVTCDDCQAELKKLGIIFTSSHSTDFYHILSTKPIETLDDLKGLRLRVGGPQFARWVTSVGATPARTPVGETFEALSQGVLDGTVASVADIVSFRLEDIIKYVNRISLGSYFSTISHAVGLETWKSLSVEDRKAIALTSTLSSTRTTQRWLDIASKGEAIMAEKGMAVAEPDQAMLEATKAFADSDIATAAKQAGDKDGIINAEAKLVRFQGLIKKWTKIATENANDPDKMAEITQQEVWDKVDFTHYGL